MYYLGIDGGGSKTRYLLIDEKGSVLAESRTESIHILQVGIDSFKNNLDEGLNKVCKKANIISNEIDFTFIGVPGYGDEVRNGKINLVEKHIKNILKSSNFLCGNDVEVGWAGSLACKPGINLVAGTGAIGFGKDSNGNKARSSGWGYYYGDEGSAFWLSKKMISYFTKESDNRIKKTKLYEIIRNYFGVKNDFEILDILYDEYEMDRKKIASLAKILYEAALLEDKVALKLYKEAAYEHFLTIKAIINKLNFVDDSVKISYSGGVFKAGEFVLEPFEKYLNELSYDVKLVEPILKPVTGAALYAKLSYENKMNYSKNVLSKLKEYENIN
ncbi:Kinase similar to eukaryotic-like N-acetylglucosamine kinase [Halanaerobium saccharolyticum subsp. saccharolyticum DSM 6643]|uniref:Kinase similar to eukaryotic-like N-acetylglucosamine kinase n=1 Tax=Halanaerobium saccharolyticum subsp. saccharolyticum DSM 6643 TaxID=1293054 RepID=M5E2Y1_9FIRM|nr:BadF/BadG/BcrA/BcrD ATPase family protein [Halanaerobium saccharolyticum]CCU80886.1 Kinase similar to eukaryotic-like N-acetylglucosamine kinase [Halanaerobium saccharolyticum subsp. saccharolyticum DSM 6643]